MNPMELFGSLGLSIPVIYKTRLLCQALIEKSAQCTQTGTMTAESAALYMLKILTHCTLTVTLIHCKTNQSVCLSCGFEKNSVP